jgi:hypothetical protein
MPEDDPSLPPEARNPEQEDESTQAQTVADQAGVRGSDALGLGDTEKAPSGLGSLIADDVPDLVDTMRQMDSSGIIDMGAFAGERNDDEEKGRYGSAADEE